MARTARPARFTAVIDAVAAAAGRDDPLVLDLGCGPGSLAVRLLDAIPAATVVAIDADPLLLAVGQAAYGARPGLRFADLDLRAPGWTAALAAGRPADAAVSSTALHWLSEPELTVLYADLAGALRPGGVVLNADRMADLDAPVLTRLGDALVDRERQRRFPATTPEDAAPENWADWWTAIQADPALAGPVAERHRRRAGNHGAGKQGADHADESEALGIHLRALQAAGYAVIGILWQHGTSRVLGAVTPS